MIIGANTAECSGCRACELLCALANRSVNNTRESAIRIHALFPSPGHYEVVLCDQCGICAAVCPTGAIYQEDEVYLVDDELCDQCGVCVEACPNGAMFETPAGAVVKCTGCGECVTGCPLGVLYEVQEGGRPV